MTDTVTPTLSKQAGTLRRKAEGRFGRVPQQPEANLPEATQKVLYELRVHQIELEIQNEQLRAAQKQLDASLERYWELYDSAPVGYCTLSATGVILEVNRAAATTLGQDKNALVGQPFTRFIHTEDQDTYYLYLKNILTPASARAGEVAELRTCELRMVKSDKVPFWVRLDAAAAIDRLGEPVTRVMISDITYQKRMELEEAEHQTRERRLQKAESLGRMAGAIAHHFNNQLQVIMGDLELALLKLAPGADVAVNIDRAITASNSAAEMSSLMLAYLGQIPVRHEPADLSEICRLSLKGLQTAAPKDTRLSADFPSPGPVICADKGQLHYVVTNLATNAWEAANENSRKIGLSVKTVSQMDIGAANRFPVDWQPRHAAYACLQISDSGAGIAENDVEKIFDPFFSTKFTGRGLGLAVVLGIVRTHQGAITVESKPGQGSIFRVFFPILAQEGPHLCKQTLPPPKTERNDMILLVEDEEQVRDIVKAGLLHLGFGVLEARNGMEAVALLERHLGQIRCVICDLIMPQMNGWETLAALRKRAPAIPVILSSGYDEAQSMAGEYPERPNAFLAKPFKIKELSDTINQVLSRDDGKA